MGAFWVFIEARFILACGCFDNVKFNWWCLFSEGNNVIDLFWVVLLICAICLILPWKIYGVPLEKTPMVNVFRHPTSRICIPQKTRIS